MDQACLFCRIVAGGIPAKKAYDDELCLAFADLHPQAPVHLLVVPKEHVASTAHSTAARAGLLGHLLATAAKVAEQQGLAAGYRIVINTGEDGGQTVPHLHLHLLGGRAMGWPPG